MITIGSTYFFNKIKGFIPKDLDTIELVSNPTNFKISYQLTGRGKCVFKWRYMDADTFVKVTLQRNLPMEIGKFLVKEFCDKIGFTIEHLKQLKPLRDNLDDKHKYEAIIFDAYIENNSFILTDEQLLNAYNEYKKYRTNDNGN